MTIYEAVNAVYQSLDALITYFHSESDKNAKAKRFLKKLSQVSFVETTYLLKDILPIVSKLCLQFQKKDIDVSMVQVNVQLCKGDLEKLMNGNELVCGFVSQLEKDIQYNEEGKHPVFKGNHVLAGVSSIDGIKSAFVEKLLENIKERFPDSDSNVIQAFSALGLRPISFLSSEERRKWGNGKIETLISKYGVEQSRVSPTGEVKVPPIINPADTRTEWEQLMTKVICEGYPRDRMVDLWGLINKYHKADFPNMLILASLALTAPVHTANCERGFSAQNAIKTAHRNRLSSARVDELMVVSLEGPPLKLNNFVPALTHWRNEKDRKIFNSTK